VSKATEKRHKMMGLSPLGRVTGCTCIALTSSALLSPVTALQQGTIACTIEPDSHSKGKRCAAREGGQRTATDDCQVRLEKE